MVTKSYANALRLDEVSIAIQRMLIAPYPTSWTAARIDLTPGSLPSGFYDLGAVVEDSPSFQISKTKYTLSTGIPAVRQYEKVIGLEGTLEFNLHSASWRKLQVALGNLTAVSSATLITSVLSAVNAEDYVTLHITNLSSLNTVVTVGDQITVSTAAGVDNIDGGETIVKSIVTNNNSILSLYCVPQIPQSVTTSMDVYKYKYVEQFYGTAENREFTLLAVADLLEGQQLVTEIYRAQPAADYTRAVQPGENLRTPLTFNLFGVNRTIRGKSQLVLAREVFFGADGTVL